MEPERILKLSMPLLSWYDRERRILPWREEIDPYHTWVSEIMLQQTRVSAAITYYERFLAALPTLRDLAEATEETLLKLWQGLGYYNRVRNLQAGAREVLEHYGGVIPADYEQLRTLKGIGDYTAGAIGSIAFGLKTPAVDGNVLRVLSRILGDTRPISDPRARLQYADLIRPIMPDGREGDLTQALMELGALVCVPNGEPNCAGCPAREFCYAREHELCDEIPKKAAKKPRRVEKRVVFLLFRQKTVALCKRPKNGLLAGLWEFPNFLEGSVPPFLSGCDAGQKDVRAKHIFSHIEWSMRAVVADASALTLSDDYVFVTSEELAKTYSVPSAFSAFLNEVQKHL